MRLSYQGGATLRTDAGDPAICEEVAGVLGLSGRTVHVDVCTDGDYALESIGEISHGDPHCSCRPQDVQLDEALGYGNVCEPDAYLLHGPGLPEDGLLIPCLFETAEKWFQEHAELSSVSFNLTVER